MKNEKLAEKLLNEGLELLSSEKPQKQKKRILLIARSNRFRSYESLLL